MANFTPEEITEILKEFFDVVGKRQYIGARYVPIFGRKDDTSIIWDGGVGEYEPLTIVLYNGNSYTSRTYVPIGVDITDQAYWANTGNYNAQVEAYRNEVIAVTAEITAVSDAMPLTAFDATNTVQKYIDDEDDGIKALIPATDFDSTNTIKKYIDDEDDGIKALIPATDFDSTNTIKKYIDDNDSSIEDLLPASNFTSSNTVKKYVDETVNGIAALLPASDFSASSTVKDAIDALAASIAGNIDSSYRNLVMIGNSYTDGGGSTSGADGLYSYLSPFFNHKYKFTTGGGGFGTYASHPTSYMDLLTTAANTLTQTQRAEITHILFVSAVGDDRIWTAQADRSGAWLDTALASAKAIAAQNFPNANVYIYLATGSASNGSGDVTNETSTALHNLFTNLSAKNGICYLGWGGYSITHQSANYSSDNYHPNDTGYKNLAGNLLNGLFGGGVVYPVFQQTLTFSNSGTNLMSARFIQTIEGIYIQTSTLERTFTSSTPTRWSVETNSGNIGKTFCRSGAQDALAGYNALSRTDTDHYKLNPTAISMASNGNNINLQWLLPPAAATLNYYMLGNIFLSSKVV